jgi:5-methylcytosine-specific restriction endonuclease McrA
MKRTKLRRKSKSPLRKAIDTADRALQDWYRAKYPTEVCENCGKRFELMHHFIEKSKSARLRFEDSNLIFLCHGCHALHHHFGDQRVMAKVIEQRGLKWLKKINTMSREHFQVDINFAEKMINKYSIK